MGKVDVKVDEKPPKVYAKPPKVDVKPPKVDVQPPKVDVQPPKVDVNPPKVDVKPPKVDGKPKVDAKPKIDTKPEVAKIEAKAKPNVESQPNVTQLVDVQSLASETTDEGEDSAASTADQPTCHDNMWYGWHCSICGTDVVDQVKELSIAPAIVGQITKRKGCCDIAEAVKTYNSVVNESWRVPC